MASHKTPPESARAVHNPWAYIEFDRYAWFTILALVGVVLNIHKSWWCFLIWSITNFVFALKNFRAWRKFHDGYFFYQGCLFTIYWLLAIWGIISWT